MKKPLLFISTLALLAPHALAGGLDKRLVGANAQWVAHLDFDSLKATSLFSGINSMRDADSGDAWAGSELLEIERELGVDPIEVLRSVTIYGSSEDPDDATIVVQATAEFDRVIERLRQEDGYRSIDRNGVQLHAWTEDGQLEAAFYVQHSQDGGRTIVFSDNRDLIANGIGVVRGQKPSLAQAQQPRLVANPTVGAFLFVEAGIGLSELSGAGPLSNVAELAQGFVLEVGEDRSRMHLSLTIDAQSGEEASNISQIANGARALASLAGDELPQPLHDMINALRVNTRGTQVIVEFDYDSNRLLQDLEAIDRHDH